MKRYFYNDPLKAAWMAREFGALLQVKDNGDIITPEREIATNWRPPYYIHPDSLPIFEPRVGDLGMDSEDNYIEYRIISGKTIAWCPVDSYLEELDDEKFWYSEPVKIIQRNGIAFFMPEVEE